MEIQRNTWEQYILIPSAFLTFISPEPGTMHIAYEFAFLEIPMGNHGIKLIFETIEVKIRSTFVFCTPKVCTVIAMEVSSTPIIAVSSTPKGYTVIWFGGVEQWIPIPVWVCVCVYVIVRVVGV